MYALIGEQRSHIKQKANNWSKFIIRALDVATHNTNWGGSWLCIEMNKPIEIGYIKKSALAP